MSLKDIEKLKEKVEKDPNSRSFVPLAEEYRKEGMLDEAVNVLLTGLEKQPGYTTARVSLGKIYYEKGMLDEARSAFEEVIKSVPDNLYSYKKLAEIYRDTGEKDLAIKSFKTVLKLNPMDEDAFNQLNDIEKTGAETAVPVEPPAVEIPVPEEDVSPAEETTEEVIFEETIADEEPPEALHDDDELSSFRDSIFGIKEDVLETSEDVLPADEDIDILEEPLDADEEEVSFGDVHEVPEEDSTEFTDLQAEPLEEGFAGGVHASAADLNEEAAADALTLEDADRFIARGDYLEAMNVFKNILGSDPDNKKVLQRVEELRTLLKLLGKDKEVLIARLNIFLEGLMKGRDEFLGRS